MTTIAQKKASTTILAIVARRSEQCERCIIVCATKAFISSQSEHRDVQRKKWPQKSRINTTSNESFIAIPSVTLTSNTGSRVRVRVRVCV